MEEKKILDFTMEHGENISVFMLNEDSDEPTLLFIEKNMRFYNTSVSNEAHDILAWLFSGDNYVTKFNYMSDDTYDYLKKPETIDTLTDVQKIVLLHHIIEYRDRLLKESEVI